MTGSARNRSWHIQTFGCKIIGTQPTAHLQRCLCKGECENKMVSSSFFSFGIKILHSSSKTTYRIFFVEVPRAWVCAKVHCRLRPGTPCTMNSSSFGNRYLRHDAANTTQHGSFPAHDDAMTSFAATVSTCLHVNATYVIHISDELTPCTGVFNTIRYDTRCYFNVRSKANMSQLNLSHGTDN